MSSTLLLAAITHFHHAAASLNGSVKRHTSVLEVVSSPHPRPAFAVHLACLLPSVCPPTLANVAFAWQVPLSSFSAGQRTSSTRHRGASGAKRLGHTHLDRRTLRVLYSSLQALAYGVGLVGTNERKKQQGNTLLKEEAYHGYSYPDPALRSPRCQPISDSSFGAAPGSCPGQLR